MDEMVELRNKTLCTWVSKLYSCKCTKYMNVEKIQDSCWKVSFFFSNRRSKKMAISHYPRVVCRNVHDVCYLLYYRYVGVKHWTWPCYWIFEGRSQRLALNHVFVRAPHTHSKHLYNNVIINNNSYYLWRKPFTFYMHDEGVQRGGVYR